MSKLFKNVFLNINDVFNIFNRVFNTFKFMITWIYRRFDLSVIRFSTRR